MPGLAMGDAIAWLEAHRFECGPPGPESGGCVRGDQSSGDWMQVGLGTDENDALIGVFVHMQVAVAPDPADLDQIAAQVFGQEILDGLLPDAVRPTSDELQRYIARNWPVELGDGWLLGFDHSSMNRRMQLQYLAPDD